MAVQFIEETLKRTRGSLFDVDLQLNDNFSLYFESLIAVKYKLAFKINLLDVLLSNIKGRDAAATAFQIEREIEWAKA